MFSFEFELENPHLSQRTLAVQLSGILIAVLLIVISVHFMRICLFFQVTGKAVMLDEIINYVQSLQRQVEVS